MIGTGMLSTPLQTMLSGFDANDVTFLAAL